MILDIVKESRTTWREITRLARPIDSKKPVIIGSNPKAPSDFEAYTDNQCIYINVNDEKKFKKNIEDIIVPAYKIAASKIYGISKPVPDAQLLRNLVFDLFLFVHFHEQMHPWLCPNSKADEKKISAVLYEGICEAEKGIKKADAMLKVNNCKNLIWDLVLNTSFISKVAGYNDDILEEKINFVFERDKREINGESVTKYPDGILPILYMTSAHAHTTDIPISLVGCFYTSLSYDDPVLRQNAMQVFIDDLASKKMKNSGQVLSDMYKGLIAELNNADLMKRKIDANEFSDRIKTVSDLGNKDYKANQEYFVETITRIFDTPSLRYGALKGVIKAISKYISLAQKQGSPDPNAMGGGGSGQPGSGEGDGEEMDGDGGKGGCGKTQEEMDEDSLNSTLDDLLDELDGKEADDLLEDAANSSGGRGAGKPGSNSLKKVRIRAIDEYYKKNSEKLEIRNPAEEKESVDMGKRQQWMLVSSNTITSQQAAMLNQKQIINFQRVTGLPILISLGGGYYRLNHYETKETQLKSYNTISTGIEIPDNWIFIQDSSGSMADANYVGSGDRFDLLNRVKYGLMKGVYDTAKLLGKDLQFGLVDFSDSTRYKGVDSLIKIYEAKSHPIKIISLTPQMGGTSIDTKVFAKIQKELVPGKTFWTMVTDGDISGCEFNPETSSLYKKIDELSSLSDNSFVFVEIQHNSELGNSIDKLAKKRDSLDYFSVKKVLDIQKKLGTLLIKYN